MACATLLVAGVFPFVMARAESSPLDSRVIAAGDLLDFRVVESGEDACILPVASSGEIEVPHFGRVAVAGKKTVEAAKEIKELLEKKLYFTATVLLSVASVAESARAANLKPVDSKPAASETAEARQDKPPAQVIVVGRVRMQGSQDMPPKGGYYLSQAIVKAGGLAAYGNGHKIQIIRKNEQGKRERFIADVLSVLRDGRTENDVELQSGDTIIIPEKLFNL